VCSERESSSQVLVGAAIAGAGTEAASFRAAAVLHYRVLWRGGRRGGDEEGRGHCADAEDTKAAQQRRWFYMHAL